MTFKRGYKGKLYLKKLVDGEVPRIICAPLPNKKTIYQVEKKVLYEILEMRFRDYWRFTFSSLTSFSRLKDKRVFFFFLSYLSTRILNFCPPPRKKPFVATEYNA